MPHHSSHPRFAKVLESRPRQLGFRSLLVASTFAFLASAASIKVAVAWLLVYGLLQVFERVTFQRLLAAEDLGSVRAHCLGRASFSPVPSSSGASPGLHRSMAERGCSAEPRSSWPAACCMV